MGRRKKEVLTTDTQSEGGKIDWSKIKAPINEWKQTKTDLYLSYDGDNSMIIPFHNIFDTPRLGKYAKFSINKESYINQMDVICKYINYFIKTYDKEHELLSAYLNIKFAVDPIDEGMGIDPDTGIHFEGDDKFDDFIQYVYDIIFTDSMLDKMAKLTEDNYLDDIEGGENGKKFSDKDKKYLESLEFTNEHIKSLLKISFGIKMLSPVIFHYITVNKIVINKKTTHLFRAFLKLFTIFSENCDMYNKLFVYVKAKVLESKSNHSRIFQQREIYGVDEYSVIHKFFRVVVISENLVKLKYKANISGFIKTIERWSQYVVIRWTHLFNCGDEFDMS